MTDRGRNAFIFLMKMAATGMIFSDRSDPPEPGGA